MPEEKITVTEAARILDLSRMRVLQLIWKKIIPARKLGHIWTLSPADVREYIKNKKDQK